MKNFAKKNYEDFVAKKAHFQNSEIIRHSAEKGENR